jgi:plasmid stabilization system protein ParE
MNQMLIFQPAARTEFAGVISWYEQERPGLGKAFAQEVYQALEQAQAQPERFCQVRGRARKIRLKRFKAYAVYFASKDDVFSVLAVFHSARKPADLQHRLK